MINVIKKTPPCPKCNRSNTYDINPEKPNIPELQLGNEPFGHIDQFTAGHARYYCVDCDYKWKKYRGKKPYERIKAINASVGGYPGPYFTVSINFEKQLVVHESSVPPSAPVQDKQPEQADLDWFKEELYKADFLNWAEEYVMFACDGTHWTVQIEMDTHCEIKTGSNHFPVKWTKFCKAVEKISAGKFY